MLRSGDLIQRDRERALLAGFVAGVPEAQGGAVLVSGDAGVGKSRLAYELRRSIADGTATVLEAHCAAHADAMPFAVIGQLLRANFGVDEGEPEPAQVKKVESAMRALDPSVEWTIPYLNHLLALPAPSLEADGLDQAQRRCDAADFVPATCGSSAPPDTCRHRLSSDQLDRVTDRSNAFWPLIVNGRIAALKGPTVWRVECVLVSATDSSGDRRPAKYAFRPLGPYVVL